MADTSSLDTHQSPIAQLLKHLGMTREDLQRHSSQMREFLTAENASFARVLDQNNFEGSTSRTSSARPSRSRASSAANTSTPPLPHTPIKSTTADALFNLRVDSMEAVIERKSKLNRKEKRARKEKTPIMPHSPTSSYDDSIQARVFPGASALEVFSFRQASQEPSIYSYPYNGTSYRHSHDPFQSSTTGQNQYTTPLPLSSPSPSSPQRSSSPAIVNIVSSPGPPIDDDQDLPYTIPPGPYPDEKPELSYAALVGQAILSSKDHRLGLQHIYEWISTVYPYFRRSDQAWMNSIRHVLCITSAFRKVPMGGKKSQWAILDQDLPCFVNGGFDRKLCTGMNRRKSTKRKAPDSDNLARKRLREESPTLSLPFRLQSISHVHSNPNLQPYYPSYPRTEPRADTHIPPRPSQSDTPTTVPVITLRSLPNEAARVTPSKTTAFSFTSSASSVPDLTPNASSSSSPPDALRDASWPSDSLPRIQDTDPNYVELLSMEALEPSATLLAQERRNKRAQRPRTKGKNRAQDYASAPSPLLKQPDIDAKSLLAISDPSIPLRPFTPPRTRETSTLYISPVLTPLSYNGLKMSPSASLAYYKNNLDPPAFASCVPDHDPDLVRTPSRKSITSQHIHLHPPVTPKKLTSQFAADSPFRTPSKTIFDPYDPGTLLDEELKRFGEKDKHSSPAGLFDKNTGLLYESPGVPSPRNLSQW